jgi:hypothetical protein
MPLAAAPYRASGLVHWHIASFRCVAEFDRYRGIADIDQAALFKLDLRVRALALARAVL